jgi:hypothetical protein
MSENRKILMILVLSFLIFSNCEKENEDFRDNYVGQYQVVEILQSYGFPQCGAPYYSVKDTIITVNYGTTDSTLILLGREVWLDSNGYYYAYHYGLRIWHDSIHSSYMNGGLGCGCYENYKGYRISNKP